ncbi:hypothetical protein BEN47_11780 [Hymenobacter lapidarius]|uniref:Uncharacterized protein n=1 Tax=Hymenobacter lapidarius TaxID=1908237 RepID=A0A1G1T8F2_9BACT|nr:hypothetical protein [Hymenobacter lapidarius]OGX87151.1 hypothetical protein BEN47_11780 [Hymenobacter lapidarius]
MTSSNFDKEVLLDLTSRTHPHSISIFIPTHRRGKQVLDGRDAIVLKNHLQTIRLELKAQALRSNDIDDLMQPLESLLDDPQFWRHRTEGLALFRSPDFFATFDSPLPLADVHYLASTFQMRPLLPYVQPAARYYLLQIGKKEVVLYHADAYSMAVVDTAGVMPAGLEEVTKYYDFEEELQGRSTGGGGLGSSAQGRGSGMAMYTSDDSNEDQKNKNHLLADYFRLVDKAIMGLMGTQKVPLLLASVAYYQPIYRSINSYPHLQEGGLTGNFDHVQPEEMHRQANEQLTDYFGKTCQQRISQYQNSSGGALTSHDLRHILESAVTGRVEVLFLRQDAQVWGRFNEETLTATFHDEARDGDESLIDQAALLTLRHGGEVYALEEVNLLDNQQPVTIAALYRF